VLTCCVVETCARPLPDSDDRFLILRQRLELGEPLPRYSLNGLPLSGELRHHELRSFSLERTREPLILASRIEVALDVIRGLSAAGIDRERSPERVVRRELLGGVERCWPRGLRDNVQHVSIGRLDKHSDGVHYPRQRLPRRCALQPREQPRSDERLHAAGALRNADRWNLRREQAAESEKGGVYA